MQTAIMPQLIDKAKQYCAGAGDAAQPQELPREPTGGEPEPPEWDPYAPLDPNDPGTLPLAPYRRARRRRGKPKQRQKQSKQGDSSLLATLLGCKGAPGADKLAFPEFEYALQVWCCLVSMPCVTLFCKPSAR